MRISIKYTETPGAGGGAPARARTVVLGDDAADMPISGFNGPEVGITVAPVTIARAEAMTHIARGNRKWSGDFVSARKFDSLRDQIEFRLTHPVEVCRECVMTIEQDDFRMSATCWIHSVKPTRVNGYQIAYQYFFVTEDWE